MNELIEEIRQAFAWRPYPGDNNIVRCTYEKRYGGTMDGPCWECAEMQEYFCGKSWRDLKSDELFYYGQTDVLLSIKGYCYFLPAYLIASIKEPEKLDACVEYLSFRFGAKEDDATGSMRLSEILAELTIEECAACLDYFKFDLSRWGEDFGGWQQRAIANLTEAQEAKATSARTSNRRRSK
ncbi:MAG: hypothetical protein JNM76_09265 [Betaproteobacteria bacterium]|nr:hypothetical protein [Betaproteobacteria bacterium]